METLILTIYNIIKTNKEDSVKLKEIYSLLQDYNLNKILAFEERELKAIEDIKQNGFVDESRTIEEILKR